MVLSKLLGKESKFEVWWIFPRLKMNTKLTANIKLHILPSCELLVEISKVTPKDV